MDTSESVSYREVAHAAAAWWAAKLTDDTPAQLVPESDTSDAGLCSGMLADLIRDQQPVPDAGQIAAFTATLAEAIEQHLSMDAAGRAGWPDPASRRPYMVIHCEYQADPLLTWAAESAGISPDRVPMKTTMRIHGEVVEAHPYYGRLTEQVWPPAPEQVPEPPAPAPVRRVRGLHRAQFTRGELV